MAHVHLLLSCILSLYLAACSASRGDSGPKPNSPGPNSSSTPAAAAQNSIPVVHVFVALCDNVHQGIVPVSAALGNGDDPNTNLYWGAAFGVKTFFRKQKDWELVATVQNPQPSILERVVFKHRTHDVVLVADAYRGREIRGATLGFLEAAAGSPGEEISLTSKGKPLKVNLAGSADVVAYVGHDGLMDFSLSSTPRARDERRRKAIILACASQQYFSVALKRTGASPLLWTTNLMAPEAYILAAALDGWMKNEGDEQIRLRAARAYNSYQNCGLRSANNLFATGW